MQNNRFSLPKPPDARAAADNIHDLVARMTKLVAQMKAEGMRTGYPQWGDELPGMIERLERGVEWLKRSKA